MRKLKLCAFLVLISLILILVNGYFSQRVKIYTKNVSRNYIERLLSNSLNKEVIEKIDTKNIVSIKYNEQKVVNSISINTKDVNEIIKRANINIDSNIEKIKDLYFYLPLGIIVSDTLFNDLGPKIKFHCIALSSYKTDIVSDIEEFGINNSLFKLCLKINFFIETLLPLNRNLNEIEINLPIVLEIINGEVPRYYYNTKDIVPDILD